jgi:hypothetical protein
MLTGHAIRHTPMLPPQRVLRGGGGEVLDAGATGGSADADATSAAAPPRFPTTQLPTVLALLAHDPSLEPAAAVLRVFPHPLLPLSAEARARVERVLPPPPPPVGARRVAESGDAAGGMELSATQQALLERMLADDRAGADVCVVGPAGCGKTAVVRAFAAALRRRVSVSSLSDVKSLLGDAERLAG